MLKVITETKFRVFQVNFADTILEKGQEKAVNPIIWTAFFVSCVVYLGTFLQFSWIQH